MVKKRLGRGLAAIIKGGSDPETKIIMPKDQIQKIDVQKITPNPDQPRKIFREDTIRELAQTIKDNGLLSPILVSKDGDKFILIAGERRLRAVKLLKQKRIDAIVRDIKKDKRLEIGLIENLQRENLNPIDIANGYRALMEYFQISHEELSMKVGKKRTTVTNTLRLLKLPQEIQEYVSRGTISMGHARSVLGLKTKSQLMAAVKKILSKKLSVRQTEKMVQSILDVSRGTKKKKKSRDPNVVKAEGDIMEKLGTKVELAYKGKTGKLIIHFTTLDDLDRIMNLMGL